MNQVENSPLNFFFMDRFTVNTCTISPICHGSLVHPESMYNCLNRSTIGKQRDYFDKIILRMAYSLQCCSYPCAKRFFTRFTFISWSFATMTDNISLPYLPS